MRVDVIVNAAKQSMSGGGGVDGAIHRAAGVRLKEKERTIGGCPVGEARATRGYDLPVKFIIHAVGPVWQEWDRERIDALLASAYRNSLLLAEQKSVKSIARRAISCGAYRFPVRRAADVAVKTVRDLLPQLESVEEVTFCSFDDKTFRAFQEQIEASA